MGHNVGQYLSNHGKVRCLRCECPQFRAPKGFGGIPHLGKSKGGLTKGGLSPKFSEKIGEKSFLRNRAFSGQIGTFSGPIGAFSGPIGTNSSAPHSHGGRAEIAPKGPFLAQLAPFGPSPPLLSPPLDFPDSSCLRTPWFLFLLLCCGCGSCSF